MSAIIFLTVIVCSAIEIGRERVAEKDENHHAKWWIYLTHWTVLICVVQVNGVKQTGNVCKGMYKMAVGIFLQNDAVRTSSYTSC
jgi:hypothetical protein